VGAHEAVTAIVLEELPQAKYRVKLENQQVVIAHPVGLARRNFVRLLPGDRVEVQLAPDDWTRGRIVKKLVS
jgi:translation initiation factor IF-1